MRRLSFRERKVERGVEIQRTAPTTGLPAKTFLWVLIRRRNLGIAHSFLGGLHSFLRKFLSSGVTTESADHGALGRGTKSKYRIMNREARRHACSLSYHLRDSGKNQMVHK